MFSIILSAILFYLFPLSVGTVVLTIFKIVVAEPTIQPGLFKNFRKNIDKIRTQVESFLLGFFGKQPQHIEYPLLLQAVFPFLLGCLTLLGLAQFATFVESVVPGRTFTNTFFPTVYLTSAIGIGIWLFNLYKKKLQFQPDFKVLGLVIGLSILAFSIWQLRAPYPLNWDLYEHQTLSTLIQSGLYSFSTGEISDTFGFASYPPSFHLLLALSQVGITLTPENILTYWNVLSFLHLMTVSGTAYYFALSLTKNRFIATLGCIIGTLSFESVIAFTSLFILPQTLTAMIWVLLLSRLVYSFHKQAPLPLPEVVISAVGLILMHYVIGTLGAVFYLASFIFLQFQGIFNRPAVLKGLWLLVGLGCLLGIAASLFLDLSSVNQGEAELYVFSFGEKINFFRQMYGFTFLIAPLGIWYFWNTKKEKVMSQLVLLLIIPFIAILFSSFPYVLKFLTLARFPLHILMAGGIWYCFANSKFRKVLIGATVVWFALILASNSNQWQQHILSDNTAAHVTENDLEAAAFLQKSYNPTSTLIISDPSTAYILEGLSGVNSAGGAFAKADTRQIFINSGKKAFLDDSLNELKSTFDPVTGTPETHLLVLSGRTFRWLIAEENKQFSFDYNMWRSEPLSGYNTVVISALSRENTEAKKVFENDAMVIFEF